MARKYGISVVSLFPWSWGLGGPQRGLHIAIEAGYDGIQYVPMWGWGSNLGLGRYVISYEDAWNYGPVWQVLMRHLGLRSNAPTLLDLLYLLLRFGLPVSYCFHLLLILDFFPALGP